MVRVVAGRVEDGDADQAAGVDCCLSAIAGRRGREKARRARLWYRTVGVPHVGEELHGRRRERVVLGEFQLGGEDAAFKGRALGALDEAFPVEEVVLGDGAGGDALGGAVCEGAVFLEEAPVGGGLGHGAGGEKGVVVGSPGLRAAGEVRSTTVEPRR